ncbi:MAG: pilus assembly protein N-terminal domain-containing protein, partial [Pseudomonadota bacterium]
PTHSACSARTKGHAMLKQITLSSLQRQMTRALAVLGICALAMSTDAAVQSAAASDLIVKYDQSQLVRLPRAVAEVIIGNPSIADVTVKSGDLLVITGKSFGITNIIALDVNRNVIQDQRVIVQRDEVATVNLQMGSSRQSYNCSPQCNPSVTVGDDQKFLDTVAATSLTKQRLAESGQSGAASAGR